MPDAALGLGCASGAVALFGTNYLPLKQYSVGDGFFFQLMLCTGIWLVGMLVAIASPSARSFEPLAALGGAVWCTGQLSVTTIVGTIGLAKGLIIWGSTAMLAGWACGVFGLLGVSSQADGIYSWPLNVSGLLLSLASLGVSLFLQPEAASVSAKPASGLTQRLMEQGEGSGGPAVQTGGPTSGAALGTCLALGAGLFFGTNFNGAQHVIDRAGSAAYPHASTHSVDYVPSQFGGILLASVAYFGLYAACSGNRPAVHAEVALPALVSGLMWGTADALWFVANENLGFVVAFPIVLAGPGSVASVLGFALGELKGTRNALLAAAVALLTTSGAVLLSLSRMPEFG